MNLDLANLQVPWLAVQLLAAGVRSSALAPEGGKMVLWVEYFFPQLVKENMFKYTTGKYFSESIYRFRKTIATYILAERDKNVESG